MSQRSWPRLLTVVGVLGALLIVAVAAASALGLRSIVGADHRLSQVSRAQRYHQDADMMHDALRADVFRAQQAARAHPIVRPGEVLAEVERHADRFRRDIALLRGLDLPPELDGAFSRLRPEQAAYVAAAEELVDSLLLVDGPGRPSPQPEFQAAFRALEDSHLEVTRRLGAASSAAEAAASEEVSDVTRILAASSLVALVGWSGLLVLLRRSGSTLTRALRREAEQRAAAELLQRSLLPDKLPEVAGVRFAARCLPGTSGLRVGGDWYDVMGLPGGQVGIVIGDVVGHDLQAATAMGQLRAALRAFAVDEPSPAAVLSRLNHAAALLDLTDMATCLYAIYNPATGELRWSSAGHLNPLSMCSAGLGRLLTGEPGPPIGATPAAVYVDRGFALPEGGSLLLYTDGLVERRDTEIDEGLARLESVHGPYSDPDSLCDAVLAALLVDAAPRTDDVTVLALQP
jgi:serine phosphatase RsbU (regulator of sigma subunit)